MKEFTQAMILKSSLKEIKEIAQKKGLKIYALIDFMIQAYKEKEAQNETKWHFVKSKK